MSNNFLQLGKRAPWYPLSVNAAGTGTQAFGVVANISNPEISSWS